MIINKRIITGNIYPQDKHKNPIYNPFGKYVVKLYLNGLWRGVTIDDYFPVDEDNNMLWSYSTNGKLWWSLLEKAYLKVYSQYGLSDINTSRDLHIFTSWIPDRIKFDKVDDIDELWTRLIRADQTRDVMVSVSTWNLSNAKDLGLVEWHAYSVLEFKEVDDQKFVLLSDPFGRFSWKGEYSVYDTKSWTPKLKRDLGYDMLMQKYKGSFWMEFETCAKIFAIIDCNWNPDMFCYSIQKFGLWKISHMVQGFDDVSKSPQYTLKFNPNDNDLIGSNCLYVVLSRLIVDEKDHFSEILEKTSDFISVHLFQNDIDKGVLHNMENSIWSNVFKNELIHSFKILIPPESIDKVFTLIIAQDSMKKDLYYSLKVFSSVKFELNKAKLYENHYEIPIDQAEGGGTPNHDTFDMNPQIYFKAIEHSSEAFNCWLSYKVHEHETAVKVYVVRSDDPQIISCLTTSNLMGDKDTTFKNKNWSQHFRLNSDESYVAIVSTFNAQDPITGDFSIKSDVPIEYQLIDPKQSEFSKK